MSPRVRGVIYGCFLVAFLLTAPLVVLYTAGFRYSPYRHALVRIGLLSVSTVPKGATVHVDGRPHRDATPVLIDGLLPGNHAVKITKTGYHAWRKTLPVDESATTFVEKAVLIADTSPSLAVSGALLDAAFDPTAHVAAFAKQETGWIEVWSLAFGSGSEQLLLRLPEQETRDVRLTWSPTGKALLVEAVRQDDSAWTYISEDGRVRVSLSDLLSSVSGARPQERIERVDLDPFDDDLFFIRTATRLLFVSAREKAVRMSFLRPVPVSAIRSGEDLFILRAEDERVTVLVKRRGEDHETPLAFLPPGDYAFLPAPESLALLWDRESASLFLIETAGADRPILLRTPAIDAAWSPGDPKTLLYSTGFELHAYDVSAHRDELVTRVSLPITALGWHPAQTLFTYVAGGDLFGVERDRRDHRNLFLVADMDTVTDAVIATDQKTAYLFGTRGGETGLFVRPLQTR